jgi:hypothetical protein
MKIKKSVKVDKSPGMIRVPSQLLQTENGHPLMPIAVGIPLSVRYDLETETLEFDLPHLEFEGIEKVGILRLCFSPEAAHCLARAIHIVEEKFDGKIGKEPTTLAH